MNKIPLKPNPLFLKPIAGRNGALDLKGRTPNALKKLGITHLGELMANTWGNIFKLSKHGIGVVSLNQLEQALGERELRLPEGIFESPDYKLEKRNVGEATIVRISALPSEKPALLAKIYGIPYTEPVATSPLDSSPVARHFEITAKPIDEEGEILLNLVFNSQADLEALIAAAMEQRVRDIFKDNGLTRQILDPNGAMGG